MLNITFQNRDFSTRPQYPSALSVHKLTWSAFGGCDQATITGAVPAERLPEFSSLLRCPVMISDPFGVPVWWGLVDRIDAVFEKANYRISLEDLYNKVAVFYSYLSPDNRVADRMLTAFGSDPQSIDEYGTREIMITRENISDDFALQLRDIFLELHARPNALLGVNAAYEDPHLELHCSGWFSTLGWRYYQNLEGYYANHGPGPGHFPFGDGTYSNVAQKFLSGTDAAVHHAWFLLRKHGAPTSDIRARLYSTSGDFPNATLATSDAVVGSTLPQYNYQWVKFTFPSPYTLAAGTYYWIGLVPYSSNASNFYYTRHEGNMAYPQLGCFARVYTTGWYHITSSPNVRHVLYFRVVCAKDSGQIIQDIATDSNQFFTHISGPSSGVIATPYRDNGLSALEEITALMKFGTSNFRSILAEVTPERRLRFYEQPPQFEPTAYLDRHGRYFTRTAQMLPAYRPPIGQWAVLSGLDHAVPYFEGKRAPAYFVDRAEFTPERTGAF